MAGSFFHCWNSSSEFIKRPYKVTKAKAKNPKQSNINKANCWLWSQCGLVGERFVQGAWVASVSLSKVLVLAKVVIS